MSEIVLAISPYKWMLASVLFGVGFATLGIIGLPFGPNAPLQQRVFWSAVLFIASSLIGGALASISYITQGLSTVASSQTADLNDLDQRIDTLAEASQVAGVYEQHFHDARDPLKEWGNAAMGTLKNEFKLGYIDIRADDAPTQIAAAYSEAKHYILAVNVGSIQVYFGYTPAAQAYVANNRDAFNKGVPVVRYYVFDKKKPIWVTSDAQAKDFRDFTRSVLNVARKTSTVFSATIDITGSSLDPTDVPDVIFMDGPFFAQSMLDENWGIQYARATQEETVDVQHSFAYVEQLALLANLNCPLLSALGTTQEIPNQKQCYRIEMPDSTIQKNSHLWINLNGNGMQKPANQSLAECVAANVLHNAYKDVFKVANVYPRPFYRCRP